MEGVDAKLSGSLLFSLASYVHLTLWFNVSCGVHGLWWAEMNNTMISSESQRNFQFSIVILLRINYDDFKLTISEQVDFGISNWNGYGLVAPLGNRCRKVKRHVDSRSHNRQTCFCQCSSWWLFRKWKTGVGLFTGLPRPTAVEQILHAMESHLSWTWRLQISK